MTEQNAELPTVIFKALSDKITSIISLKGLAPTVIERSMHLVNDIGLGSIEIATLISMMDIEFDVDPFSEDFSSISNIRSVGDIEDIYLKSIKEVQ